MPPRERVALFALIAFSVVAFLPVFGEVTVMGVAVFGWLMAILLLGSPAILLLLVLGESGSEEAGAGGPEDTAPDP